MSKYIINQDIDESISQGIYNASKSIENIGPLLSIESCIDKTTKSTLLPNNIIVIGNSCAGKTTFIDYFKKYYNIYSDIDDLEPLLEAFMLDDLLYQNKIEEFKKIKNKLKYVNKIWEEYNDNINSINHYTKPANLGDGHDIIRPILWDYIIQMAVVNLETHNIIQFSRGKDELYESQFSQNAYFRSIKNFIDNSENYSNSIIVNLVSSLEIRKNRNRIRFENGGHYVSDDTMDKVYSKDIFEYTKTGKNFGYLLVDGRTIPVYTIVNDKTLNEIELNKFLEYNVNKVIEYYNDFKEENMEFKKIQKDIWQNKLNKGFNTTDVNKEFCLLYGEVAEAYDAWKKKKDDLNEELADIAIYLMGLSEMLGFDLADEIEKKVSKNEKRVYKNIDGVNVRISD